MARACSALVNEMLVMLAPEVVLPMMSMLV